MGQPDDHAVCQLVAGGRLCVWCRDVRILLFAAAAVLAAGIGTSILPALQASAFEPFAALKDGGGRRAQATVAAPMD